MWNRDDLDALLPTPLIGMIHCRPLPGAPGWCGELAAVVRLATADAEALAAGGAGALMLENYHDVPFHPGRVPAETVAALTAVAMAVRRTAPALPLGINVLRNDGLSALAIAAVAGASFIRVNVLSGATVTDQGLIQGEAAELLRTRDRLCPRVGVLADLDVKHGRPLAARSPRQEAADLRHRALADGLILSGENTGAVTDPALVAAVRRALPDCPLLIGSGAAAGNVGNYPEADAFIIGTSLQRTGPDGRGSIDRERVARCASAVRNRPARNDSTPDRGGEG